MSEEIRSDSRADALNLLAEEVLDDFRKRVDLPKEDGRSMIELDPADFVVRLIVSILKQVAAYLKEKFGKSAQITQESIDEKHLEEIHCLVVCFGKRIGVGGSEKLAESIVRVVRDNPQILLNYNPTQDK